MQKSLLNKCQALLPNVKFVVGNTFYWSPATNSIHYSQEYADNPTNQWALLHEVAHAQLGHTAYSNDAALLKLEVDAWEQAKDSSKLFEIIIDPDHVQECLNTYRDWLYARSTCPACALNSLQIAPTLYKCLNCSTRWSVSQSRFCRPYRMKSIHTKTPSEFPQTVFS